MMSEIERVIATAKAEIGYLEKKSNSQLDDKTANAGSNNYTKYARDLDNIKDFYNGKKQGFAWCDVFVDWCFVQTFGVERAKILLCQPDKSLGAGVGYSAQYYKQKGQFYNSPKVGDQIFFNKYAHTGLVVGIDNSYVYTIEGNTSSASGVVANGGCVRDKKYSINSSSIDGYGRPNYVIEEEEEPSNIIAPEELEKVAKDVISGKYGNGSDRVKNLEQAGYNYKEVQNKVNEMLNVTKPADTQKEYYTIQKGDTLSGIAQKYKTTVNQLAIWNNIKNINLIFTGTKIRVK